MSDKQVVYDFLNKRKVMALATFLNDDIWICNVFYVVDEDLNLYFLSGLDTIHVQQLLKNSLVACTISDSDQDSISLKKAVQIKGQARKVQDLKKVKWFIEKWKTNTNNPKEYSAEELAQGTSRCVFKITPTKLKYFDQERYKNSHDCKFII